MPPRTFSVLPMSGESPKDLEELPSQCALSLLASARRGHLKDCCLRQPEEMLSVALSFQSGSSLAQRTEYYVAQSTPEVSTLL